jgi:hypothetical protein
METVETGGRWPLSAPESYLLANGPAASAAETLKLALTELVATGRLRLATQESRLLWLRRRTTVLAEGARRGRPVREPLRAALAAFERTSFQERAAVKDVARAVVREYGSLNGYRDRAVVAPLIAEGLVQEEEYTLFWRFTARRRGLSRRGIAARDRLAELQRIVRLEVRGRAHNPSGAIGHAAAAGAGLLLVPELFPELRELARRRMEAGEEEGVDVAAYALSGADAVTTHGSADAPTALLDPPSLDLSFDFGALDDVGGLDAAMDAIDGGVSDGGGGDGGDGGGDGGGGD